MPSKRKTSTIGKVTNKPGNGNKRIKTATELRRKIQQTSKFFELPPEIRNMIYNLVLVQSTPCTATSVNIDYYELDFPGRQKEPGLVGACQLIRNEARPVYYSKNTFAAFVNHFDLRPLFKWLQLIGTKAASSIQKFDFWLLGAFGHYHSPNPTNVLQFLEKSDFSFPRMRIFGESEYEEIFNTSLSQAKALRKAKLTWDKIHEIMDLSFELLDHKSCSDCRAEGSMPDDYMDWHGEFCEQFGRNPCYCRNCGDYHEWSD